MEKLSTKVKVLLGAVMVVFFVLYGSFFFLNTFQSAQDRDDHLIFNWPDEMANSAFIGQFVDSGKFSLPEELNSAVGNIIHPRSTNVRADGEIVPAAFLGFTIVYGLLAKLVGLFAVNFLTPLFGVLAALALFGLARNVFGVRAGLISFILCLTLGTLHYYSSLVMLPNVFFVFCALAGFYFLSNCGREGKNYQLLFVGFFLALSAITRPMEAIWLVLPLIVCVFVYRDGFASAKFLLILVGAILPVGLFLYYNYQTYGAIFASGYLQGDATSLLGGLPPEVAHGGAVPAWRNYLRLAFAPFGFYERTIWSNVYNFIIKLLWPYLTLFGVGLTCWFVDRFKQKTTKEQFVFIVSGLMISVFLIIYYGSWKFADALVVDNNTISNSFARYWLPIHLFFIPIVAYAIDVTWQWKWPVALKYAGASVVVVGLMLFSFRLTYLTPGDGLIAQGGVMKSYYERYDVVKKLIVPDSIIIFDRTDKLFFPEYRLVDFNYNYQIFPQLKKVINKFPVYYLSYLPDELIGKINAEKLDNLGLKLEKFASVDNEYELLRLVEIK
ncbi:hypothetical protein A2482_00600 [Candidatus Falkowbacteria bacterium RIFOXYC2_FULL_48_21]|uniref:Glycosyltransferase RgtA/B/C/D-like domain-containing protein n=1 Tax=Candidatus Falkowbacteria bacterium RIFOXYC2_FULL_48_21 TaxID=1798005 RepID=A0A1F5T5M9_9BACT|nr:MAG: hypothetical protein A2482_00600 [Candidatus Falkowbacteria bacterium RIFOXYC2_FULL_48_21]